MRILLDECLLRRLKAQFPRCALRRSIELRWADSIRMKSVIAMLFMLTIGGCRKTSAPTRNEPVAMTNPRKQLLAHIQKVGDPNRPDAPRALVSLEEFFQGNDDYGSIGYNFYPDQPSPADFHALFKRIRSRGDVVDVRVQITSHDDPDAWPATDTVWLVTSAPTAEVATWLGERFAADELFDGFLPDRSYEDILIPPGTRPVGVWWD